MVTEYIFNPQYSAREWALHGDNRGILWGLLGVRNARESSFVHGCEELA